MTVQQQCQTGDGSKTWKILSFGDNDQKFRTPTARRELHPR